MDLINYMDMKFKDIEKALNVGFDTFRNPDSIHSTDIRQNVYEKLKKSYPFITFRMSTYTFTEFAIDVIKDWDYREVRDYCSGGVHLNFKISVKKTDDIKRTSRMRYHAVYAHNPTPIKFVSLTHGFGFRRSVWQDGPDRDNLIMVLNPKGHHPGHNGFLEAAIFNTINEVLNAVPTSFEGYFIQDMVEPFANALAGMYYTKNMVGKVPEDLLLGYKNRDGNTPTAYRQLEEFAFTNFFMREWNVIEKKEEHSIQ